MAWSTCQPVTRCGSTTEPIFTICLESLNTRISGDGAVAVVVAVAVAEEIEPARRQTFKIDFERAEAGESSSWRAYSSSSF
jgi:hypothetical protein